MSNTLQKETCIPFCGFYESEADMMIDHEIEYAFNEDIPEDFYLHFNGKVVAQAFSKEYVPLFVEYFKDHTGIALDIQFKELYSPRYYNFETDRIFCNISMESVKAMFDYVGKECLNDCIQDRFTDRDGFISFYQESMKDPKQDRSGSWNVSLDEWDHNQIETLIIACLRYSDVDNIDYYELMEDASCNGVIHNVVWDNCGQECLDMINEYDAKRERG